MAEWTKGRYAFSQKTGFIESPELQEVVLPDQLKNFNRFMFKYDDIHQEHVNIYVIIVLTAVEGAFSK